MDYRKCEINALQLERSRSIVSNEYRPVVDHHPVYLYVLMTISKDEVRRRGQIEKKNGDQKERGRDGD